MWSVLRRIQGEEYSPSLGDNGLLNTMNHIASFECRPNPKPSDPLDLTQPYEIRVYNKLVKNLQSEELLLRRKAVTAMLDLFALKDEHAVRTIQFGGIPVLLKSLEDVDTEVRMKSCIALQKITATTMGLKAIISEEGPLLKIKKAAEDPEPVVVVEALRVFKGLGAYWNNRAGTKALIKVGCVPLLIRKATDEDDRVKAQSMAALNTVFWVEGAYKEVLENGGMEVLTELLSSEDADVLEQAAENMTSLCEMAEGKECAVSDTRTMKRCMDLMIHPSEGVRAAAAGAVMAISIDIRGKFQSLECRAYEIFGDRLQNETNIQALLFCIRCIGNVAETPVGRQEFHAFLPRLDELALKMDATTRVPYAAMRTMEIIKLKP